MPSYQARHAKKKENWGGQPSRSQQRAAAGSDDPARSTTPAKQKKGVCKGPDGWQPEHKYVTVMSVNFRTGRVHEGPCHWQAYGRWEGSGTGFRYVPSWRCFHEEACERCGHVREWFFGFSQQKCPDFTGQPVPEEVKETCSRKQEEYEQERARRLASLPGQARKKTGRLSYRKPKATGGG